jgi:hypothetical protein
MRFLALLALMGALCGAANVAAATRIDPVATYKSRVNATCRALTATQLEYTRAAVAAAKAGDRSKLVRVYVAMIGGSYTGTKRILNVPVPTGAQRQMRPIRELWSKALAAIDRAMKTATDAALEAALDEANAYGKRADPLLDAAGLTDCGTRQTSILKKASKAIDKALASHPAGPVL